MNKAFASYNGWIECPIRIKTSQGAGLTSVDISIADAERLSGDLLKAISEAKEVERLREGEWNERQR